MVHHFIPQTVQQQCLVSKHRPKPYSRLDNPRWKAREEAREYGPAKICGLV